MPDLFASAREYFERYAAPLNLESRYPDLNLRHRLLEPDRSIEFRVSLQRDNGTRESYKAYRVQFNDDRGPYKGGLRIHPDIDMPRMKALAFWMYLKTAVVNIPFGGARGGISVDYRKLSLAERERLIKRYPMALIHDLGSQKDILSPDVNSGEREMAWIMDSWRMMHGQYDRAIVTGKPAAIGGWRGRRDAQGKWIVMLLEEALRKNGQELKNCTVAIQGFGKVGQVAALHLEKAGAKIAAVSNSESTISRREGIDVGALIRHVEAGVSISQFPGAQTFLPEDLFGLEVDILVTAALEESLTADLAETCRAALIAEGSDSPSTPSADIVLAAKGITVIPDILCSAGGVVADYFEWVQNRQELYWSEEEADRKFQDVMKKAADAVFTLADRQRISYRAAAFQVGIERVVEAVAGRGVH
jgi:glutamate dehydrogenase/leucine dehydrogenase